MSRIYIGNLPLSVEAGMVRDLFSQHGTVDTVALVKDCATGRSRGFGYVEMPRTHAICAIQNLNGHDVHGQFVNVTEAADRPRIASHRRR